MPRRLMMSSRLRSLITGLATFVLVGWIPVTWALLLAMTVVQVGRDEAFLLTLAGGGVLMLVWPLAYLPLLLVGLLMGRLPRWYQRAAGELVLRRYAFARAAADAPSLHPWTTADLDPPRSRWRFTFQWFALILPAYAVMFLSPFGALAGIVVIACRLVRLPPPPGARWVYLNWVEFAFAIESYGLLVSRDLALPYEPREEQPGRRRTGAPGMQSGVEA